METEYGGQQTRIQQEELPVTSEERFLRGEEREGFLTPYIKPDGRSSGVSKFSLSREAWLVLHGEDSWVQGKLEKSNPGIVQTGAKVCSGITEPKETLPSPYPMSP